MGNDGLLFADALCIDQASPPELQKQLPLIPMVYEKAAQIIVWLGRDGRRPSRRTPVRSAQRVGIGLHELQPHVLRHITSNPYWTRLFVVPELILA
ncbi:uncharacterized protein B0I36DRAFT_257213, partial [Microdochium trichocladiopsis]